MWTPTTTAVAVAVTRTPNGNCLLAAITPEGGLTRSTTVQGGSAFDDIRVFSWNVSFCGYNITPLITNGHRLTINGGNGNDRIENYSLRGILLGGYGNDLLIQWEGDAYGEFGDDHLIGDHSDKLYGGPGNDDFNTQGGKALVVDGGDHRDRHCGDTVHRERIEQPDCNW